MVLTVKVLVFKLLVKEKLTGYLSQGTNERHLLNKDLKHKEGHLWMGKGGACAVTPFVC